MRFGMFKSFFKQDQKPKLLPKYEENEIKEMESFSASI